MSAAIQTPRADGRPDIARETEADLCAWGNRWPVFEARRFRAVAHTAAAHLPDLSRQARALAGLVSLWIIAFDALVDEDRLSTAAIDGLVRAYRARLLRPVAGEMLRSLPLGDALDEIVRQVTERPVFAPFAAVWRAAFLDMLDAIVEHRRLGRSARGGATLIGSDVPTYATVLALTTRSVGVRWYLVTCFILYDAAAMADRRAELLACADACAVAIRLANDVQTWERDLREGNVNTLWAIEQELAARPAPTGDGGTGALEILRGRLDCAIVGAQARLRDPVLPGAAAAGMARLLAFVTGLYARSDYHSYVPVGEGSPSRLVLHGPEVAPRRMPQAG